MSKQNVITKLSITVNVSNCRLDWRSDQSQCIGTYRFPERGDFKVQCSGGKRKSSDQLDLVN